MHSTTVTTLTLESIDRFHSSLSARGNAEHTVKAYTTDLRMFLTDLKEPEVTPENFEMLAMAWLQSNRQTLSPKTTGRRLTSLRAFARWAGYPGVLADYRPPTPAKSVPHPLPEGIPGVWRLIEATDREDYKALIALCGLAGTRVGEALRIGPQHFDLANMQLTIRGKGDKTRVVPVSSDAWTVLARPVTRAFCERETQVIHLKDRFARRVVTDLGKKAGLKRAISSHDLRATFATAVYEKTKDLRLVQELLGHASSTTTELYTAVAMGKLKAAVEGL